REAADGSIWAASHAGLARLVPGANAFTFVPGIDKGDLNAFAFGPGGSLWIARTTGLQHYLLDHGHAALKDSVRNDEGWPYTGVLGLQVGSRGRVFALGTRNLLVYDPHNRQLHAF